MVAQPRNGQPQGGFTTGFHGPLKTLRIIHPFFTMDQGNLLQMLLLRGLGTTSLLADRLRSVSQEWVLSGRLDPKEASALVDDVLKALRGETPELEQQAERQLERNRDQLLADLGLARQREVDELRGRIDRLEQALRQRQTNPD
jgi:polyhydroxyalkanoate synthesis regulator phasin